ncbi:MAG: P1 family peptidase [Actinomycetota bacterium]
MITRVAGIRVGHHTDLEGGTGCTVILAPDGTVGSGEVRGGAPGTRETDLLRPGMLVQQVNAVLLTGGSAFGLAAADGVMTWLAGGGVGFDSGLARVPIVPAAVLFDLGVGDPSARPDAHDGVRACEEASDGPFREGTAGAGTGATVAKLYGHEFSIKGGIGSVAEEGPDGLIVGSLIAVNAVGEVLDEAGGVLAGSRAPVDAAPGGDDGPDTPEAAGPPATRPLFPWEPDEAVPGNTVIGVIATNARLSKERANLLAIAGHEGIAQAVRPSHTRYDGDTLFTLATGEVDAEQPTVEALAERVVAEAIRRAVRVATPLHGVPSIGEGVA